MEEVRSSILLSSTRNDAVLASARVAVSVFRGKARVDACSNPAYGTIKDDYGFYALVRRQIRQTVARTGSAGDGLVVQIVKKRWVGDLDGEVEEDVREVDPQLSVRPLAQLSGQAAVFAPQPHRFPLLSRPIGYEPDMRMSFVPLRGDTAAPGQQLDVDVRARLTHKRKPILRQNMLKPEVLHEQRNCVIEVAIDDLT